VVVDHVFERQNWYDECIAAARTASILLVGVRCPREIAEERERTRQNRRNGLVRSQFDVIHDTSVLSPEARIEEGHVLTSNIARSA
jgi:chloramphenicol 3-O-phosphotransferase